MIIKLSPQRRDDELVVSKRGDVLTINTERFDFREIPEGAVLPASAVDCEFIVGDITRLDGELMLTLLLPCSADASAAATYPADIVNPSDGNVRLPQ
ncbi:hypothetical protein [Pseudomonas veronii]|uniref:hypothetical protein n=1 Tax=Pseudomonas veronii TaxID=76761 RepID=UPI000F826783|nr:hypothetical protein [Pseudomonas veronii]RTY64296.1 hypothetical protein EKA83_31880 [Pseudomonas veronii]